MVLYGLQHSNSDNFLSGRQTMYQTAQHLSYQPSGKPNAIFLINKSRLKKKNSFLTVTHEISAELFNTWKKKTCLGLLWWIHKQKCLITKSVILQVGGKELSLSEALNCNPLICLFSSTSGKSIEEQTEKKKCSLLCIALSPLTDLKVSASLKRKPYNLD